VIHTRVRHNAVRLVVPVTSCRKGAAKANTSAQPLYGSQLSW
jgi:hypothetical protein